MRRVVNGGARGLTLIEVMVAVAIAATLLAAGMPYYVEFALNSRLREGGNGLFTEALAAQSEAIRRNTTVRLDVSGSLLKVINTTDNEVLRTRDLGRDLYSYTSQIDFSASGAPVGNNAAEVYLFNYAVPCSSEVRCPKLRVEAGGGIKLCGNQLASTC